VGTGIQPSLDAVRLVSPFAPPLVPEQRRWFGQLVRGYLVHSAVPANLYQRPFRLTAPRPLRRRVETSGFLGFARKLRRPFGRSDWSSDRSGGKIGVITSFVDYGT
jgi:hypothetical protein